MLAAVHNMLLPVPAGPKNAMACPWTAATMMARLAASWPLITTNGSAMDSARVFSSLLASATSLLSLSQDSLERFVLCLLNSEPQALHAVASFDK